MLYIITKEEKPKLRRKNMETFAEYILNEHNLVSKIEIMYYLAKKTGIFFDKSVLFKTELARQFIDYMKIDVDRNMVLTASLLCNCKKINDAQKLGKLYTYASEGALYLKELGFDKRFCKICEEINRYSGSNPRERESDILELVDQFGGMLLDRPERIGFETDEALILLQHRNMKDVYNRYLQSFVEYVEEMDKIFIEGRVQITPLKKLAKLCNETTDIKEFIKQVAYEFAPEVDSQISKHRKQETKEMFNSEKKYNPYRTLFSEETTRKIMSKINNLPIEEKTEE